MTDDDPKLERLVQKGRKLEAIQRLRERTGMGLAEAKAEIERIEMRATAVWAPSPRKKEAPPPPGGIDGDVKLIAQQGRRIEAIKLLRERRKLGLKEAKDLLDAEVPPPPTSMKWLWAVLLIGAVAVAGWFLA